MTSRLRRFRRRLSVGLACAALVSPAARAWRPETQEAIARAAARIAPPDLARQIERRERAFLAGVRGPLSDSPAALHVKNADGTGELDAALRREMDGAIAAIRAHHPFDEIVERLGRVSHFVADLNLPLNAANVDRDERAYFRDYLDYAESARPRYAVVFYGLGSDWRGPADVDRWMRRTLGRGRELYGSIGAEYRRIGLPPAARGIGRFDDRSTAFAVAALSYSHAVSDAARAFRYVWIAAGGADPRLRLASQPDRMVVLDPGGTR